MPNRNRRRVVPGALILLSLAAPATAAAVPVSVDVRVEGATQTIFEGPVVTDAHGTKTPSDTEVRTCDGSPDGPTAISALDDAARAGGFGWDAQWSTSFSDYGPFLRIGPDAIDDMHYLAFYLNSLYANTGACNQNIGQGDDVLFAYEDFAPSDVLRLTGPSTATTGQSVSFLVEGFDGVAGAPAAGATVGGATTGPDGVATLSFAQKGVYRLKAERADAIRSNAIVLCVDPPGALPCSSTDSVAPSITAATPGGVASTGTRLASATGKSRTMLISWAGDDGAGAGVSHYTVEVNDGGAWRTLLDKAPVTALHFKGDAGKAYRFRITATDRALNAATLETGPVVVPVDDRSRRLWRFSKRGWTRMKAADAWGGTVVRAAAAGASARFSFRGSGVSLVGRRLANGGRLRVTLDGKSKVVRVRGRSGHRTVLWESAGLGAGRHVLSVRTLGGGPVELDAVAPTP